MSLLQEGRLDECSSRNAPDSLLDFAPTSPCSNVRGLTSRSAVLTHILCLGLEASDIEEKLRDWRENKKHTDFPHFCIWFPCQWLSREMLIPLHPVLHSCADAGCTPARWRKYYSFYPFPEGKSPSVVHLITAGYCDWNFHYKDGCQESQRGLFWKPDPTLTDFAGIFGLVRKPFPLLHSYLHNSVNRNSGVAALIPSTEVLLVLLLSLLQSLLPK